MRIDLLTTELRTGGAERCLTELALGLHRRGDRVRVLSLGPLPRPGGRDELLQRLLASGIEVQTAEATGVRGLLRTLSTVQEWLQSDRPDVLQTFLYHGNLIGTWAGAAAGVRVRIGGVRVAQPRPWRWWLERLAVRRMTGVVCVSRSVEAFARRRLRPPRRTRVVTIANGVHVEALSAAAPLDWSSHGILPGSRVLLFMGRLHRQKGLDLLLDAAPGMLARHRDLGLVIVGEGPLETQVKRTLGQLPVGRAVHLPWQADVGPLYAGAELVVVPSRYEGMPNVVLEAMAAGRPVAVAQVEGVAELLGEQFGRQTFAPGRAAAMLERVETLLGREDLRELGRANQQRAAECFSIAAMVQRYRDLYEQLRSEAERPE